MSEPWQPAAFQKRAVKFLVTHPAGALFMDPGLRKTSCTLAALKLRMKAGAVDKTLVIAPKRVCYLVWSHDGEVGRWDDFKDLRVALLHGDKKRDAIEEDADLYVINPAGLRWLVESGGLKDLLKRGLNALVVDELSAFKHPSTQLFRTLKPHLDRFKTRWGLTGSPAANGLLDLFGQCYVLDQGQALGQYISHYRATYFVPSGFGGYQWKPQVNAEERIYSRIKSLALSMRAEDHLDLPPLVEQNVWVDLPPKARLAYSKMEEVLLAEVDGDVVSAANAAAAGSKCRQIASGGAYLDPTTTVDGIGVGVAPPTRRVAHLHDEKTDALADLVDELQGSPLLVLYEFDHDLARIRARLGEDVPAINGKTPDKKLAEIARAWNAGETPVLCGHPAAMGHGLNLQGAGSHVAWYTLTWNFELYDQAIRRVYRSGQKSRVVVHRLLARDTVEATVAEVISRKKRTQDDLLTALKSLRARRVKAV